MSGIVADPPRRIGVVIAAACIVAMSAAAIIISPAPGSGGGGGGLSPAAAAAEYQREVRSLGARGFTLAPGWEWPVDGPAFDSTGPDGAPMAYEKGYGAVRADRYWFYTWVRRAVGTHDRASRRLAIEQLLRVRDTLFFRRRPLADQAYTVQVLERASHGDLALLREWVLANAPTTTPPEVDGGP